MKLYNVTLEGVRKKKKWPLFGFMKKKRQCFVGKRKIFLSSMVINGNENDRLDISIFRMGINE